MKVAACQIRVDIDDVEATRQAAVAAVRAAAGFGAELVILPELVGGYVFADRDEAMTRAELPSGATGSELAALSADLGVVLVAGFCERTAAGDGPYNSALVLDQGELLGVYRKTHLWDREKLIFVAGQEPAPVLTTSAGRLAVMICYDLEFPEMVRDVAVRGAQLLAVPANWPTVRKPPAERPIEVVKAQAFAAANRVFIAVADRCGPERGVNWFGASVICGVDGYPLAGPGAGVPVTLTAEVKVHAADDKTIGPHNHALDDRRADIVAA